MVYGKTEAEFILGIGDSLYEIRSSRFTCGTSARFGARKLDGEEYPDTGRGAGSGLSKPVVRLAPQGRAVIVPGGVDYAAAEALLADAAFWSSLGTDDAARLAEIADRITSELAGGRPGADAMAGAYAIELVVLATRLAERYPAPGLPWKAPVGVWSIDDAVRCIEADYADSFSLDWFVGKCAMNVTDFSRRFKERAGCPLFEFINRQRVARACAFLKSSDLSIIDIAEAVGYNNLSYFNRYFLRIVGVSPREYRASR